MANPFTSLEGAIVGGGIGIAVSTAAEPVFEPGRQAVWRSNPYAILIPEVLAMLVAQGLVPFDNAAAQAQGNGIDGNKFRALVELAKTAPPVSEALELRRRERITDDQLTHAMAKAQIEPEYWPALAELQDERLSPQEVALGIVRSVISDPGLLVKSLDTSGSNVPVYTPLAVDALKEAAASGISKERLRGMVGEIGLPASIQQAASGHFRGILTKGAYNLAVLEGDTRPEWGDALLEIARAILSPNQYAELELRGFLTQAERRTKTDQYGMSDADSDLLYNLLGRSIPVHQITTGQARGGDYGGAFDTIPAAYLSSLRRGNLRPEFYNLAYANRYSYPSGFQIRGEAQAGRLSEADTKELLLEVGWSPKWATHFAASWTAAKGSTGQTHVQKAETQLWNTQHTSYKAGESDAAEVGTTLTLLNVPQAEHGRILALWDREREIVRKQLTPTQIKKAWKAKDVNPATGQAWTDADALARLESMGYSPNDAETFLFE